MSAARFSCVCAGQRLNHAGCWKAPPAGFEPAHPAPEAGSLSPELRGLRTDRDYQYRRADRSGTAGTGAVVAGFTLAGFWWLTGYHLVVQRYYQGWAADRPYGLIEGTVLRDGAEAAIPVTD